MNLVPEGSRTTVPGRPVQKSDKDGKVFINRKFYDTDFSGKDLTHSDFRGATLVNCNFDSADLSYANFESANCYRSSFRQSKCYHTNFKDAVLAETKMDPRDMFGMTISVSCDTFDRIHLGPIWLAAWIFLPTLGELPENMKEKMRGLLKDMMGEERVVAMERIFANRQI
jgi:Pentapeptide repeats (9 copies)